MRRRGRLVAVLVLCVAAACRYGGDPSRTEAAQGAPDALMFGVDLRLRAAPAGAAVPRGDEAVSSDDPRYPELGERAEVSALTAWSSLDDEW